MTTQGVPERFSGCKPNLFIATPCTPVPKITGSVRLADSSPLFADSDMGDGAIVMIEIVRGDKIEKREAVKIFWLDWNEFEYESVGF